MIDGMRGDLIPAVSPNVHDHLMECLRIEVDLYLTNIQGGKCILCPFRSFNRLCRLKKHTTHHSMENMYMADIRSPQLHVIRALYDQCQSVVPISLEVDNLNLLQQSAALIADWNSNCSAETMLLLKRQNRPVLIRVLTHTGPQY